MRNIASSSSTPKWTYDVFLSFRGEDVRKNFVDFLYSSLQQKGIYTFKDDEKLERGRSISSALLQAIKESRIAVIIFSENYAASSWCLDELAEIIYCNQALGQTILPVFYYVDPSVVRKQKGSFGQAFVKHEDEIEDKERIRRWRAALAEAASISGWDVPSTADGHESKCIQQIVEDVMGKLKNFVEDDEENHVGIHSRVQKINAFLNLVADEVRSVGIWGMSGIGKTTLARAVFDRISTHFEGAIFLHEVREHSKRYGLENLQEKILSEILRIKELRINNVFEGSNMIKKRLCYKKVLIVLDDIDHLDQLEALAGKHDWFGKGSRIIITTKDKHLLVKHDIDRMYKVEVLDKYEAVQLFSWNAFKKNCPAKDYEELSLQIVHYAGGLPLALKILGSFLYGRDMTEWRSEVERLKKIPEDDIMKKLTVSFDGLQRIEKEIFLDIACFFKGKKKENIARVLDSFNFYPHIGIKVLIEKSLITVSKGRILMHPLIQEMGWQIVREKAPEEPGKHSRLWVDEDICDVLARDRVTENVEGLWLHLSTPKYVAIKNEAFEKMIKLRLLKIHNAYVSRGPNHLPNEIRWLNWHGYPSKSLPDSFQAEKLVGIKLQNSRIIELWKGIKFLNKLKFINLSHSQKLIRTPDFTGIPSLERLVLENCSSLIEIHSSAGYLKSLKLLNLRNCTSLRRLPKQILLESLEVIILSGCSKVDEFPEILGPMNHLRAVYWEATAVKELPPSIENLTALVVLNLSYCKSLASLPSSISKLKCLKALILSGCSKLGRLPEELGYIESLEEIYGDETAISQPPSSIILLKNLRTLSFRGCQAMALSWRARLSSLVLHARGQDSRGFVFPSVSGLNSLAILDLSDCSMLDEGLPCDLGSLSSLQELNLGRNNFSSISASSIRNLSRLRILELIGCKRLQILPELPRSIEQVYADDCTILQGETNLLTKSQKLNTVSFTNCFQMLQGLQTSKMVYATWKNMLKELPVLHTEFSICSPGQNIPAWFTYQDTGHSISVQLPPNWYCNEFMGMAICIVFGLKTPVMVVRSVNRENTAVIPVQYRYKGRDKLSPPAVISVGAIAIETNVDSEHTCLAYLPCRKLSQIPQNWRSNDWTCIELSSYTPRFMEFKAWGVRLVYQKDVGEIDNVHRDFQLIE
ncbi:TMV resistance protein N isoform X1 [Coffea arabica]|uniref:ADP-ribosyl cyclase/cyclic ADP-ribose hydrolase n=1 Tax=Coffea arabica TaxID=13443 RepID=A0A6P6TXV0_COFAR|nr:TMV resistance protein N-like isoform X1 [Coffea arabica]